MDERAVGITGSVSYSMNGGRTEYNNWELDGGDNMDNGSNSSLNVYPSIDAIAEFKVLTSNYGAQYGRNGSGTVEVETKGGTNAFHGDAYEFVRNDAFNANTSTAVAGDRQFPNTRRTISATPSAARYTSPASTTPTSRRRFSSGRRNGVVSVCRVSFNVPVPYSAERRGNFSDLCLPCYPRRIVQSITEDARVSD